jgi:hypothetical protein
MVVNDVSHQLLAAAVNHPVVPIVRPRAAKPREEARFPAQLLRLSYKTQ